MATSNQFTYTVTRDTIVRNAMLNLGKLAGTEVPTPQELTDASVFLNMLVRQYMGRQDFANGLKMWSRARGDLMLSLTKGSYVLSPQGDNWAGGVAVSLGPNWPNFNYSNLTANAVQGATVLNFGTSAVYSGQTAASITGFTVGDFIVVQLDTGDIYSSTIASINLGAGTVTMNGAGLSAAASSGALVWNYTTKQQPPLEIHSAILRDSQQNDTPLNYMTLQEYEALPTKVQPGYVSDPTAIYYEPTTTLGGGVRSGVLYLDVAGEQDVTKTLHIVGLRPLQAFVNPTDNPDFPEDWELPLSLGLSKYIAPMFNAVWTKEMDDNLKNSLAIAQETTPETTAIYFQCHAEDQI